MVLLIFSALLALAGIGAIVKGNVGINAGTARYPEVKEVSIRWIGSIVLGVAVVLLIAGSVTVVPTRNVAVQTSFGKPSGTLGNGFHLIAPWSSTEEFDASIQTLKLSGENEDDGDPLGVRLANAATATVDVTVQWQVDPDADITALYLDYKNFENIGKNVVRRQLSAALNEAFETYDPLASLKGSTEKQVTLGDLADRVKEKLDARLPKGVIIRSILIPKIMFEDSVQQKINQFLASLAETQIAEQRKKTAEAQKQANDLLASANNTHGVLYQNCLDMVERLVKEGKNLPAAFTCGLPPTTVVPVK